MKSYKFRPLGLAIITTSLIFSESLSAQELAPLNLRSTASFTILAATTITTTGGGTINGNIGLSPGTGAAIHLTAPQVAGTIYAVDATGPPGSVIAPELLDTAKGDLTLAYNEAKDLVPIPTGPFLNPGAGNIGGMTLGPGLYKFDTTALITGSNLTLSGGADDVWVFQVGSDLQVGSGIQIILAGNAKPWNVFWQVGTSAVLGTTSVFKGSILADQSITMNTSSTMDGRALASNGAVTYNGSGGSLPVPDPPRFTAITRTPEGEVTLTLEATPNFEITLQSGIDLTPGSWLTIERVTPVTSPFTMFHASTGPKRFYRAFLTPR